MNGNVEWKRINIVKVQDNLSIYTKIAALWINMTLDVFVTMWLSPEQKNWVVSWNANKKKREKVHGSQFKQIIWIFICLFYKMCFMALLNVAGWVFRFEFELDDMYIFQRILNNLYYMSGFIHLTYFCMFVSSFFYQNWSLLFCCLFLIFLKEKKYVYNFFSICFFIFTAKCVLVLCLRT